MASKIPVGVRIDEDLIERARNAIWHVGQGLTITSLVEQALTKTVADLEKHHNGGKPFPPRKGQLAKSPKK